VAKRAGASIRGLGWLTRNSSLLKEGSVEGDFQAPSHESVRLVPAKALKPTLSVTERLRLFDAARQRQRERESAVPAWQPSLIRISSLIASTRGTQLVAVTSLAGRGAAAYQLSWFDAHLWANAEHYGMAELYSEDFQHDRLYGSVRVPLLAVPRRDGVTSRPWWIRPLKS
jgi:predicted nucleic acid-binding protein